MQKDHVIQRDFYYKREITFADMGKFAGITICANLLAYFYMLCFMYLTRLLSGSTLYIIVQFLGLLPIAMLLPIFIIYFYLRRKTPAFFSLADSWDIWYKKAFRWVAFGEILRFLLGLLPFNFTKFGVTTSPATYLLYSLCYVEPLGKFDAILVRGEATALDTAVFLIIYILYFVLSFVLLAWMLKKEIKRHQNYLQGCLNEKEKFYKFN